MKILMINVVCGIRSTGRMCTDLADALHAQGHEVKIAYGRENVPEQLSKYAVRIGSDLDVFFHVFKSRMLDASGFGSELVTEKFVKWIREYNPDVIHIHNLHGYYINIEILFNYLRTSGKRIIWTLHDCWAFTGHTAYCDVIECKKWKDGCFSCPLKGEYPKTFFDRSKNNWLAKRLLFTNIPDITIVTPSQWLANLVAESFLGEYQVTVIHNGIDTGKFKFLESNFKEIHSIGDKKVILGVATSWDKNKGFGDYLELANLLGEKYQVVLVGVTEEQLANMPSNILGIKGTNSVEELAKLYSAADYVLNMSKTENYPIVNLEAMCCGTPVITYDVGGSKESVEPAGGIVVPRGDIKAIESAIRLGSAKCVIDIETFDKKKTTKEYLNLYM